MSLFHRVIDIDINTLGDGLFKLVTNLTDMFHHIVLEMLVSAPDFIIEDVVVEMKRIPHPNCRKIYSVARSLRGLQIGPGFTKQVLGLLGGEEGCPNMVNLVLLTAPLAINAAAVLRQKQENLTQQELDGLWQQIMGGICVAYPKMPKDGGS